MPFVYKFVITTQERLSKDQKDDLECALAAQLEDLPMPRRWYVFTDVTAEDEDADENWEPCDHCGGSDQSCGKCRGLGLQRKIRIEEEPF